MVHLTGSTFREFIQTHSSALVMFYAPCKSYKLRPGRNCRAFKISPLPAIKGDLDQFITFIISETKQ